MCRKDWFLAVSRATNCLELWRLLVQHRILLQTLSGSQVLVVQFFLSYYKAGEDIAAGPLADVVT